MELTRGLIFFEHLGTMKSSFSASRNDFLIVFHGLFPGVTLTILSGMAEFQM